MEIVGIVLLVILFVVGFIIDEDANNARTAITVIALFTSLFVCRSMIGGFFGVVMAIIFTVIILIVPYFCKIFFEDFTYDEEAAKVFFWIWGIIAGIIGAFIAHCFVSEFGVDWLSVIFCAIPFITAIISTLTVVSHLDGCGFFGLIGWFLFIPLMIVVVAVAIIGTLAVLLGLLVTGVVGIVIAALIPPTVTVIIISN